MDKCPKELVGGSVPVNSTDDPEYWSNPQKDPVGYIQDVQLSIMYRDTVEFSRIVLVKDVFVPGVFWDTAVEVCKSLTTILYEESPAFFETLQSGLEYLVDQGNPKELLLIFLEQVESLSNDDLKFRILLEATQKVLLKLPSKRVKSFESAVDTFSAYVEKLELPDEKKLEGEEKKLLEGDPNVVRIGEVVKMFLRFLSPFVDEVSRKNPQNLRQTNQPQIETLTHCLFKLLNRPLLYVDLSHADDAGTVTKTNCRENAERVMEYLSHIYDDFHKLIVSIINNNQSLKRKHCELQEKRRLGIMDNFQDDSNVDLNFVESTVPVSETGLSCFLYLIQGEQLKLMNWPSVFSHEYILTFSLPFIKNLLSFKESLIIFKGIFLAESVLDRIANKSLSFHLLEIDIMKGFILALTEIMLQCSVQELRQLALKLLPYYLNKFDLKGRYYLMMFILHKVDHSGVSGLVINTAKNQIAAILKSGFLDVFSEFFIGPSLERLLKVALRLPEGATSDLLDQSDRIMSGLNLIRFILLSDNPAQNLTGIWNRLDVLENGFLNPLKTGIDLSQAHYNRELKTVLENKDKSDVEFSVNIGGVDSPLMSKQQKIEVLRSASVQLDMMDSVYGRVCELVSSQISKIKMVA